MNTVVVELRLSDKQEYDGVGVTLASNTDILRTTDELNDVLVDLALYLDMDILSISHSHHFYHEHDKERDTVWCYTSTCVYSTNGQTATSIAEFFGQRQDRHAFEDRGKVSIVLENF